MDPDLESEPEALISVQTESIANANEQTDNQGDHVNPSEGRFGREACFICNSPNNEPFVCLYTTHSLHSGTSIFEFVWKLLGDKPSVRNETTDASCLNGDVICSDCLTMINKYDAARVTTKRFRNELCEKLAATENHFARIHNTEQRDNDEGIPESMGTINSNPDNQCTAIDLCDED